MPTFLWGLQGDLVTLAAADFSELENAASSEEFDQTLRVGLSLAHLKAADPVLYENAIAEGELLGFCPGRVASEILAQRLLFACAESGEEVEDLRATISPQLSPGCDHSFHQNPNAGLWADTEPSLRILVKAVDLSSSSSSYLPSFSLFFRFCLSYFFLLPFEKRSSRFLLAGCATNNYESFRSYSSFFLSSLYILASVPLISSWPST